MEYGHLELVESSGKPTVYMGEIAIPKVFQGDICLIACEKRSDNSPDWRVKIRASGYDWAEAGAGWSKKLKLGGVMFSVTLDAPWMVAPLYVAAFPSEAQPKDGKGNEFYTIKWRRAIKRPSGVPNAADPVLSDSVPY